MSMQITKPEPLPQEQRQPGFKYWGLCAVWDNEFVPDGVVLEVMKRNHKHHVKAKESVDLASVTKFLREDIALIGNEIFQACGHHVIVRPVLI